MLVCRSICSGTSVRITYNKYVQIANELVFEIRKREAETESGVVNAN